MLDSFAETLIACTQYVGEELDENELFKMLACCFLPLQKAAFFMLGFFYENHIPKLQFK
jgi:hypothetical protein